MGDMAESEIPEEPGWYNDPEGVRPYQAYWDGKKWTGETRPSLIRRRTRRYAGWSIIVLVGGGYLWIVVDTIVKLSVTDYYSWELEGPTVIGLVAMTGVLAAGLVFIGIQMVRNADHRQRRIPG